MSPRQIIPLTFGQGLDRETGIMVARPASFEDLRNLLLYEGKAIIRKGVEEKLTFEDSTGTHPMTHELAIQPLRAERAGIVIAYDDTNTGEVNVYGVDANATIGTFLGTWFNHGTGKEPPIVQTTEIYGRVFMAHDEPAVTRRAQTFRYDRRSTSPLAGLEADLDGDGESGPVRFRGVVRHLAYLVGWGYGTETEDRAELIRISKVIEPESFDPDHYFIVGDRRQPVLKCLPFVQSGGRASLGVWKEQETHELYGSNPLDFGMASIDPSYGILNGRLAVNVSGRVYFWSAEGPRVSRGGGPSDDAALPLDLLGFDPLTLVSEGELRTSFAEYVPNDRVVVFCWGQRVYALSIRSGIQRAKWSYWELGFTPMCAGRLFAGDGGTITAPTGSAECGGVVVTETELEVTVDLAGQDGDEFVEVWWEIDEGDWQLVAIEDVVTGATQVITIPHTSPGSSFDVAVRLGRGFFYTTGYTDPDPDNWPTAARCEDNVAPIAGLEEDGLLVAYFTDPDGDDHSRLTFVISQIAYAAALNAIDGGGTAGIRVEVDTGGGFSALADLSMDRDWTPARDHKEMFHFGWDKEFSPFHGGVAYIDGAVTSTANELDGDPWPGPYPIFLAKGLNDDGSLGQYFLEWDDEDHGVRDQNVTYRAIYYIGGTDGANIDRTQFMGIRPPPPEVGGVPFPASYQDTAGFGLSSVTAGEIVVTMSHARWYRKWLEGTSPTVLGFCTSPGQVEVLDSPSHAHGQFRSGEWVIPAGVDIWYRDVTGGGIDTNSGTEQCNGGAAETEHTITGLVTGNTYEVFIRYFVSGFITGVHLGPFTIRKTVVVS